MGRRRRKVARIPKKRLPQVFLCPQCGKEAIRIDLSKEEGSASIGCGACGLADQLPFTSPTYQEIDVYCRFTDKYYDRRKSKT
jgi:transcription elongation factor Elf1